MGIYGDIDGDIDEDFTNNIRVSLKIRSTIRSTIKMVRWTYEHEFFLQPPKKTSSLQRPRELLYHNPPNPPPNRCIGSCLENSLGIQLPGTENVASPAISMAVCQNLVPLVNIKIAGKWMFIPLKMVLIGIDPYPYGISMGTMLLKQKI